MCEDLTDIATSLGHICETVDYLQEHFAGRGVEHDHSIPPEKAHPAGTHPTA
jgi:hypothetical protein